MVNDVDIVLEQMEQFGDAFVQRLAGLYRLADMENKITLLHSFKKYFLEYDNLASAREENR